MFGAAIFIDMKNDVLRVLSCLTVRILRWFSVRTLEFFSPIDLIEGDHKDRYSDYPIDPHSAQLVSPDTIKKLMDKSRKLGVLIVFCLRVVPLSAQDLAPQIHGILRGKYEYQPEKDASRLEVRNARLSAEGSLPMRAAYKLEVDLCDESAIKMKDAWVRLLPCKSLRLTIGQQRMPFSIDAHRNPSAQYFANRSFIAKQVGDMRDVGFQIETPLQLPSTRGGFVPKIIVSAGIFNGSNLDNQKTAWFSSPSYSARIQYFPIKGLAIVPSIQHQLIAERKASYTSLDFGSYFEKNGWHIEAEYLHKRYSDDAFADCDAVNSMLVYKHGIKRNNAYVNAMSYLMRYDYMDDHSDGKKGLSPDGQLILTDYARHRLTAGISFHIDNNYFPTDLRLNYEKYWYPAKGVAKESEQDKVVCEVMIRF